MREEPKCPDCSVELIWPMPADTPPMLRYWVGGPYTCPKCGQEYDVTTITRFEIKPKVKPQWIITHGCVQ